MKFLFRVDASVDIGIGHVIRSLALASDLSNKGHNIGFVCRALKGNYIERIKAEGFEVYELGLGGGISGPLTECESEQELDAEVTCKAMNHFWDASADWVVVDHYSIDSVWHKKFFQSSMKLMVIDDLANRDYACDLLLDQTLNRTLDIYKGKVSAGCRLLLGTNYALLRPEFTQSKDSIVRERRNNIMKGRRRLLILFGGTDPKGLTIEALSILSSEPYWEKITVVVSSASEYVSALKKMALNFTHIKIKIDVKNMSETMLEHDISMGAGGGSVWERCAMGLPSAVVTFAENQNSVVKAIVDNGAAYFLHLPLCHTELKNTLVSMMRVKNYMMMVNACLRVCDGGGIERVVTELSSVKRTFVNA